MVYVANDGRYIIKDRSITNSMDLPGNIEITYPMDNFPCDDLIAPAVAELLKRGYQTKYCCQGHIAPDFVNDISTVYGTDIPIVENFEVSSGSNVCGPYIMFDKSVTKRDLYNLPSSWEIGKEKIHGCIIIRAKIRDDIENRYEFFTFHRIAIECAEDLYKWACGLPSKK